MTKFQGYNEWASSAMGVSTGLACNATAQANPAQYTCSPNSGASFQATYPVNYYNLDTQWTTASCNGKYEVSYWCNGLLGSMNYQTGTPSNIQSLICNISQPAETPEERVARTKLAAEQAAKRKAASVRAEHLLFTVLTPLQVRQYTDHDYFEVVIDNRTYRIRKGYSRNVELIEAGKPTIQYCAHPANAYDTPTPDAMLAQLLMLKTNEQEFLRLANRTMLP